MGVIINCPTLRFKPVPAALLHAVLILLPRFKRRAAALRVQSHISRSSRKKVHVVYAALRGSVAEMTIFKTPTVIGLEDAQRPISGSGEGLGRGPNEIHGQDFGPIRHPSM